MYELPWDRAGKYQKESIGTHTESLKIAFMAFAFLGNILLLDLP